MDKWLNPDMTDEFDTKNALVLFNSFYMTNLLRKYMEELVTEDQKTLIADIISNKVIENEQNLIDLYSELTGVTGQIPFRRLSGKDDTPGLLDALKSKNITFKFLSLSNYLENHKSFSEIDFIIAPMTMQDIEELYAITDIAKIPVYPRTTPKWESKLNQRNLLSKFAPDLLLPFIYIDSAKDVIADKLDDILEVGEILGEESDHVFVKDDEGFHSGSTYPYYHGKVDNLEEVLSNYANSRVSLIVEPLIYHPPKTEETEDVSSAISKVIKIHGFAGIHQNEYLVFDVYWKSLEGKYGPDTIDKIERLETEQDLSGFPFDKLDKFIKTCLPYNMVSMDFVIDRTGTTYYSIDINHAAGTFGEVQEINRSLDYTIFDKMVDTMRKTSFERYIQKISTMHSQFDGIEQTSKLQLKV